MDNTGNPNPQHPIKHSPNPANTKPAHALAVHHEVKKAPPNEAKPAEKPKAPPAEEEIVPGDDGEKP